MKTFFKLALCLTLITFLTSCAGVGSKTIYKDPDTSIMFPKRIGFTQLQNENILNKIVTGTSNLFDSTMNAELNKLNITSEHVQFPSFENWSGLKKEEISSVCHKNQLDGLVFTKLKYINTKHSMMLIPTGQSQDTEVEMQYFDASGNLICHTKHSTILGNSYMNFPSPDKTVPDGTVGALKRLFKELHRLENS